MHTPAEPEQGGERVDFVAVLDQVIALLRQRGRLTYRTLQRQFQLDEVALEDLKEELIYGQRLAVDEDGRVLVWTGATGATAPVAVAPTETAAATPLTYTPSYLAEKIFMSRSALEGERKQVTVLFADLKGSMELLADRDPEEARQLLDPVLERLMAAVHRYEGTVNQIMGDGIMALFGPPWPMRTTPCVPVTLPWPCRRPYAAIALRCAAHTAWRCRSASVSTWGSGGARHRQRPAHGLFGHWPDHAPGRTHGAARHAWKHSPDRRDAAAGRGLVQVTALGPVPVKAWRSRWRCLSWSESVPCDGAYRRRWRGAVALCRAAVRGGGAAAGLTRAGAGQGQVVALIGEPGVGKSRLVYEFLHAHYTQGWLRLESSSVSYGKATAYLPVCDLLKAYCHIEDRDDLHGAGQDHWAHLDARRRPPGHGAGRARPVRGAAGG